VSEDTPMNTDDRALADLIGQALTKVAGPQTYYRTDDVVAAVSHLIAADRLEAFHVKPVVGERYSASGDHVVDVDDHNTFQVVPVNRVDGDSLAISVAEAMNAAISTPVAAQGDVVREALREVRFLCNRLDELDFSVDMDEFTRLYMGHIDPSHSRLKDLLADIGGDE